MLTIWHDFKKQCQTARITIVSVEKQNDPIKSLHVRGRRHDWKNSTLDIFVAWTKMKHRIDRALIVVWKNSFSFWGEFWKHYFMDWWLQGVGDNAFLTEVFMWYMKNNLFNLWFFLMENFIDFWGIQFLFCKYLYPCFVEGANKSVNNICIFCTNGGSVVMCNGS